VAPLLAQEQVLFAGLDVIDGRLIEINVTSPTLVRELQRFSGVDIPARFWDRVLEMMNERAD
jgi:glutathione synthase